MTEEEIKKKIARELKIQRLNSSLSQVELANKSGVHRNTIDLIEREDRIPTVIVLYKICLALDKSLPDFFELVLKK